jgi:hypothetical protein
METESRSCYLLYGPEAETHSYLIKHFCTTPKLLVISSVRKIREEWESLSNTPTVITPQTPNLLSYLTPDKSVVIIEQAQSFRDVKLDELLTKHSTMVYTHCKLFKQLDPVQLKPLFTHVAIAKTRFFNTIAPHFNVDPHYQSSQEKDHVQVFSNNGNYLNHSLLTRETQKGEPNPPAMAFTSPSVPPTSSSVLPTSSSVLPTSSSVLPTSSSVLPTSSSVLPTSTPVLTSTPLCMTLTVTMDTQDQNTLVGLTKKFTKNVFSKEIHVYLKNPTTKTYVVEVEHEAIYGDMVLLWLYHLANTISKDIASTQNFFISFQPHCKT